VAHFAKLNYEVFECVACKPPLHVIKLDYACEGEILKKKVFRGLK